MIENAIRTLSTEEVINVIEKQENNPVKKKPFKTFKRR
jgi:hypothetical protein